MFALADKIKTQLFSSENWTREKRLRWIERLVLVEKKDFLLARRTNVIHLSLVSVDWIPREIWFHSKYLMVNCYRSCVVLVMKVSRYLLSQPFKKIPPNQLVKEKKFIWFHFGNCDLTHMHNPPVSENNVYFLLS